MRFFSSSEGFNHILDLQKITDMEDKKQNERKWLVKKDLMRYLSISQRTVENWMRKGVLRAYKVGTRVYFDQNEVDDMISRS